MAWQNGRAAGTALLTATLWISIAISGRSSDALWTAHVEPLLKNHCLECHNPTKAKSGLDLTSLQAMLKGGERGPAVVPGRPDDSNLYKFLRSDADPHMPPGARKPLGSEEASLIEKWIKELPIVGTTLADNGTNSSPAR